MEKKSREKKSDKKRGAEFNIVIRLRIIAMTVSNIPFFPRSVCFAIFAKLHLFNEIEYVQQQWKGVQYVRENLLKRIFGALCLVYPIFVHDGTYRPVRIFVHTIVSICA